MGRLPPRYDVPKAAPEPLRIVQTFVNTINRESGEEWLRGWFEERGAVADEPELERARPVREALRELLFANNGERVTGDPLAVLTSAADAAGLSIDFRRPQLVTRAAGVDGVLGRVLVASFLAMSDGTWGRLKCCRNTHCGWAFYDYSKNRSASWCSMQLCGNRTKTRAYRARKTTPSSARPSISSAE
ncbi:MAG TPA: CGNR zinc finger domain-containing protein [Gaiellaceae bacterium]|nr:CGNR zinc finger domain-containing protein [Gaiellaceae bacterium]